MAKRKVTWKIELKDCVKGLRKVADADLVFADPPYNIGVKYERHKDSMRRSEYIRWCTGWIRASYEALQPHGSFWIAINDENVSELDVVAKQCGFYKRTHVVWYYTFGQSCVNGFARSHTHMLYYTKHKKKFTFNAKLKKVRVPSARQLVYNDSRANPNGKLPDNTWVLSPFDLAKAFTKTEDTWLESRVCGTFKAKQDTPNQLPIEILNRVVLSTSKPGDLVVDPFGGSSTTGVAAITNGRNYLGFDNSGKYCKAARLRMRRAEKGDLS